MRDTDAVRLEYRVVPASAVQETADVMRARLAEVGLEDARVSMTASAGLTIDAPADENVTGGLPASPVP